MRINLRKYKITNFKLLSRLKRRCSISLSIKKN